MQHLMDHTLYMSMSRPRPYISLSLSHDFDETSWQPSYGATLIRGSLASRTQPWPYKQLQTVIGAIKLKEEEGMDDDTRTLYCGNLSERVTEDILYELFLQGGPIQKISIPKDREGKQRTYGFITYKHIYSVEYALHLFDGTMLYNRILKMKLRNNTELQQTEQSLNPVHNVNHMLELGQQMILGNYSSRISSNTTFGTTISQDIPIYPRQLDVNLGNDDRIRRSHPYQKNKDRKQERDRDRNREKEKDRERSKERNYNNHYRDERSYYNRDNSCHSIGYSQYSDNRKRWTYH